MVHIPPVAPYLGAVVLVLGLGFRLAAAAAEPVDLELVIATDVSRSIDEDEARLQRQGIAAAFRDQDVIRAIQSGFLRRIGVAYIDYSSTDFIEIVIPWRIIADNKSAENFADALIKAPLTYGQRTSISDALEFAVNMIETNTLEGTRRVIDVSGDGPNNHGRLVSNVRDETAARNITINGLPIINTHDAGQSRFYLPDLDKYYRGCVIGGVGAFYVVARDFADYARAIRKKLIFEIAGLSPDSRAGPARFFKAAYHPRATGYVYEKGCDIGERMRRMYWDDPDDP